jgi:hypothetical protein
MRRGFRRMGTTNVGHPVVIFCRVLWHDWTSCSSRSRVRARWEIKRPRDWQPWNPTSRKGREKWGTQLFYCFRIYGAAGSGALSKRGRHQHQPLAAPR